MIAHVVLFTPRPALSQEERTAALVLLERTVREIPSIRRVRIGRRVVHGRPYEQLMQIDYAFAAVFEFDDMQGLEAYLNHSAHEPLAATFFALFERALMYDFELADAGATGRHLELDAL
jgi:hypothetical protein